MDIADLLVYTVESGASDLHITVDLPPSARVHGEVEPVPDYPVLSAEMTRNLIYAIMNDRQRARFEETHDVDFSLDFGERGRFRVNVFMGRKGVGAVLRVIPSQIKSTTELGLPAAVCKMSEHERGLVLVTGPTGSGKSTTLAALIDQVNEERQGHILTVEDPIEFVHPHKKCVVNQREVGPHTQSFANALRAALREDPDVILVGEMRDLETISLAISAAETGHLVFGTLHTSSAAQTIDRIIDVFPSHQQAQIRAQLSESLRGVVAQTLLKVAGGKGRVAAVEVMVSTSAIRNLIREGKTFQIPSMIQTGFKDGMQTLEQSLCELVQDGRVTEEEAYQKAADKEAFQNYMREGLNRSRDQAVPAAPARPNGYDLGATPAMNIMGFGGKARG
jgi:twitching motility protein PilT